MTKENQYEPYHEEALIKIQVSAKEAHLIKVLRKYSYGKFVVSKIDGKLIRVQPEESITLNESEGIDLAIVE